MGILRQQLLTFHSWKRPARPKKLVRDATTSAAATVDEAVAVAEQHAAAAVAIHGGDLFVTIETDLAAVAEVVDPVHHPVSATHATHATGTTATTVVAEPQCETRMFLLETAHLPDVAEADGSMIDAADPLLHLEVAHLQRTHALFPELPVSRAAADQFLAAAAPLDVADHHLVLALARARAQFRLPARERRKRGRDHQSRTETREAGLDHQLEKEASESGRGHLSEMELSGPDPQPVELNTAVATAATTALGPHHLPVPLQTLSDASTPSLAAVAALAVAAGVAPEADHRAEDATLDLHPPDLLEAAVVAVVEPHLDVDATP